MELETQESGAERLLVDLLRQVIEHRAPETVGALEGGRLDEDGSPESVSRSLQTVGLLSQILPIAELHDAMAALDLVRATDPQRTDADELRSDIQRQLLRLERP